jgi:hypothetical protein
LAATQLWITRRYRVQFPGVALVQYRDERDSVGFHRDREMRWLDDTIVGVATFGAQRPWLMRPDRRQPLRRRRRPRRRHRPVTRQRRPPRDGRPQPADWLHAVPKVRTRVRSRISAQWRWTSKRGRRDTQPGFNAPPPLQPLRTPRVAGGDGCGAMSVVPRLRPGCSSQALGARRHEHPAWWERRTLIAVRAGRPELRGQLPPSVVAGTSDVGASTRPRSAPTRRRHGGRHGRRGGRDRDARRPRSRRS